MKTCLTILKSYLEFAAPTVQFSFVIYWTSFFLSILKLFKTNCADHNKNQHVLDQPIDGAIYRAGFIILLYIPLVLQTPFLPLI